MRYSDFEQSKLDQKSGEELDRRSFINEGAAIFKTIDLKADKKVRHRATVSVIGPTVTARRDGQP